MDAAGNSNLDFFFCLNKFKKKVKSGCSRRMMDDVGTAGAGRAIKKQ